MAKIKLQGRETEITRGGRVTTLRYQGTRAEMEALASNGGVTSVGIVIGSGAIISPSRTARVNQVSPNIWECEIREETGVDGNSSEPPDTGWGKKSCQLHGGMLSRPLEACSNYQTRWNHYLFAKDGVTAIPEWYDTASGGATIADSGAKMNYAWGKSVSDCPAGFTSIADPTKPGEESFDTAVYTVTETARFRTAAAAGAMVAAKLNKIGTPTEDFGLTGGGDWKCDDAEVSWSGKYWLARLTWTRSGDDRGWDPDLYGDGDDSGGDGRDENSL